VQMQHTLLKEIVYEGIGLHTGKTVTMRILPADCKTGMVFVRSDLGGFKIQATPRNVTSTMLCTTLGRKDVKIHTVEHVLAALYGMGVDNAIIELDSVEPPVGDGSSACFVELIKKAGLKRQSEKRVVRKVSQPVWAQIGGAKGSDNKYIIALPSDKLRISFTFVSPHPAIGVQYGDWIITSEIFEREIAPARTLGFLETFESLKKRGLALGGNMDTAVVVGEEKILTPLRFEDEIVRHKVLDVIGDISLLGPVCAHFVAVKSGHALNNKLARLLDKHSVLVGPNGE
jgi:UDP-3-O-[3-hydroxymyristoyl] N-acetylglucosamine deacetylase